MTKPGPIVHRHRRRFRPSILKSLHPHLGVRIRPSPIPIKPLSPTPHEFVEVPCSVAATQSPTHQLKIAARVETCDFADKVLDAAEAAEKQTLSATSSAATRMVSNRFGENAGEATGDALAAAGHCVGTAWNVLKIRKAINPATSASSGMLKNAIAAKSAVRK